MSAQDQTNSPENGHEFLEFMRNNTNRKRLTFDKFEYFLDLKAREKGVPIMGQFELTPLCNFNCRMCYAHLTTEQLHNQPVMSVEQWKTLIHQAYDMGMYRATLTGGECLSYPGFKEIYLYLHSLGCEVSILTNGALLDEKWVQFFLEHRPIRIQITLYGNNEDAYERVTGRREFKKVIDNIRRIREAGLPLEITTTPNQYLGEDIIDTVRVAKEVCPFLNINPSIFTPREETGRAEQKDDIGWELYVRTYRKVLEMEGIQPREIPEEELPPVGGSCHECTERGIKCAAGMSAFSIDWKGNMRLCNRINQYESHPLKVGFRQAWNEIHEIALNWPRVPECEGCAYSQACHACAAEMLQYAEPGKQPLEMCERTRYFVKNGVWMVPECE